MFLSTEEAAARAGVKPVTIRQWKKRGLLKPAGKQARMTATGRVVWVQVFAEPAVMEAEAATRRRHGTWQRLARRVTASHDDASMG
jgi:predicted site-specific integrase-resolvase